MRASVGRSSNRWPHPLVHPLAWLVLLLTLLLVAVGAMVTTTGAGMAFPDWPTSDGHSMLGYPWWQSQGDRFWEHGHRLAGMLVGFVSLALTAADWGWNRRRSVHWLVGGVLLGVIAQGLLGGARVAKNDPVLALVHGNFAAWVFSLMAILVTLTSPRWSTAEPARSKSAARWVIGWGYLLVVTVQLQYIEGGILRHLAASHAWLGHPWFAIVVAGVGLGYAIAAWRSGSGYLAAWGSVVAGCIAAQIGLGLWTWVAHFGVPEWGWTAGVGSTENISVRSLHKVLGLVTLTVAVVGVVRAYRVWPAVTPSTDSGVSGGSVATAIPSA